MLRNILLIGLLLFSTLADAGRVILQPVSVVLTTGLSGTADLSMKVPGTFTGLTDDKNGRYFKGVKMWTDGGAMGDRIYALRLEDTDGILNTLYGLGQFPNPVTIFPNYPTLLSFQEDDIVETSTLLKGFFISPDQPLDIEKIDPREVFDFVPSGMYFRGTFKTANGLLLGQKIRINFYWGKLVP